MTKRKLRRRVKLLEQVSLELVGRIEALEGGDPPKWRDNYGPAIDLDPRPPLSDELQVCDPLPVILDDEDDWRAPGYL